MYKKNNRFFSKTVHHLAFGRCGVALSLLFLSLQPRPSHQVHDTGQEEEVERYRTVEYDREDFHIPIK